MSESKVEEDIHKDIELSETSPTPLPMQEESASIRTVSDRLELPEPNFDSDTPMKSLIPECDSPDAIRSVQTQPCKQSFPTFKVTKQSKSK
jgi:hypothetical protein